MMMMTEREAPVTILVVEDDAIVAEDIREALRDLGYEVVEVVRTGEEAVRSAGEHAPDLVLMDIRMPGPLDGVDAAHRIRDRTATPVVYLTAHSDARTVARTTPGFGSTVALIALAGLALLGARRAARGR